MKLGSLGDISRNPGLLAVKICLGIYIYIYSCC